MRLKWKSTCVIAGILAAVIAFVGIMRTGSESYAKETLQGVETIIQNNGSNNPYVILEVVPEKNDAAIGYLVGGEEPVYNGRALNEIPNSAQRVQHMNAFTVSGCSVPDSFGEDEATYPIKLENGGYLEPGDGLRSFSLRGSFVEDANGEYVSLFHEAKYLPVSGNSVSGNTLYEIYYEFENLANTEERYQITLSNALSNSVSTNRVFTTTEAFGEFKADTNYNTQNKYSVIENETWSGEIETSISGNAILDNHQGEVLFTRDSFADTYQYFGSIQTGTLITTVSGNQLAEDSTTQDISYINAFDGRCYVVQDDMVDSNKFFYTKDASPELKELKDLDDGIIQTLKSVELEANEFAGEYTVSSVTPITASNAYGYLPSSDYQINPDGHYIKESEDLSEFAIYDSSYGDTYTRYNWVSDYSMSSSETVKYQGGFTNREWLRQFVFDLDASEYQDFVVDVKTVTMEELNTYDLSKVGLVYFAGGTYQTDITKAKVLDIKKLMETNNLPVIFNRSTYLNAEASGNPNLEKLGVAFQQTDFKTATAALLDANWDTPTFWSTLDGTMKTADATYGLNYVNQSLYLYDDTDFNAEDALGAVPLVHPDFISKMTDAKVTYGFKAVKEEIESENFFLSVAGKTQRISTDITKASAIRYIINFGNKRNVIKTKISVLEIEPCNSKKTSNADSGLETYYTDAELKKVRTGTGWPQEVDILEGHELLTKEKIAKDWAQQFDETDKINNIRLTRTHTGEFVGKIEDLNENYDLIYLGLDTSTMNTELTGTSPYRKKTTNTIFNDPGMKGLVYYHVGDVIKSDSDYFLGLLDPRSFSAETTMPEYRQYRMSGNDITLDKYNDLVEFMNAGYPIVLADGFYTKTGDTYAVNTAKIDRSSYMYQVAQYALDHQIAGQRMLGENVFTETMLDADTTGNGALSKLAQYLNLSKLSITSTYQPEVYSNNGGNPQYLSKTDGNYVLRYDVALKNDAAVSLSDTKYDCKLFIDKSVDGRYASDEEIGNLNVYELKNGSYVQIYQNASGQYELTAGKYYKILRAVPDGYVGVLPWKLQFVQNDNTLVRRSLSGFTAVPIPTTTKKTIRVLNITHQNSTATSFNLESTQMQGLLAQVKDFNIEIDVISAQEYMRKVSDASLQSAFSIQGYSSFLNNYQMLIIGFMDSFRIDSGTDLQDEAGVWAIRQYISEGRSVLFTHDNVSYNYCNTDKTYWFNLFIRDSVGMDRYGVMTKYNINQFQLIPATNKTKKTIDYTFLPTKYDTAWLPKSNLSVGEKQAIITANPASKDTYTYRNIQAFSDFLLLRNGYWLKNIGSNLTFTSIPFESYSNYDNQVVEVTKINQGQVTEYPFQIPDTFEVANTHGQWLQLNLDTDSSDAYTNDDIVVWYAISNVKNTENAGRDYYQASLNNARNNYYIYNRGNVTYSGVGHSSVNNETEMKLFINTMVAAYNAGISPPSVLYKEGAAAGSGTIEKTYLPFDSGNGATFYLENEANIFFDVIDTNIKYGTKTIHAEYFKEVSSAEKISTDLTKIINGTTFYLRKITPVVTKTSTAVPVADPSILEDGTRYQFTLSKDDLSLTTKNSAYVWIFTDVTYKRTGENGIEVKESSTAGFSRMEIVNLELFDLE